MGISFKDGVRYVVFLHPNCLKKAVLAVDCYTGVYEKELIDELSLLQPAEIILVNELYKDEKVIAEMTERFMTDDVLFGYVTKFMLGGLF